MQTIPEPLAPVTDESKLRELAEEVAGSVARKALEGAHKELGSKFDEFVLTVTSGLNDALMSRLEELALPAKTLTIELLGDDGEIRRVEGAHAQMPELLYWANSKDMHGYRWPVMLFGKPGVSKSFSTKQAADAMGLSFGLISLNPQTPESRLFGFIDAGGKYHRTLFREAFENGGVFLIDEIDNANDALLTSLNSCLANGHGAFPDGRIERHADFVCVATANTPGRGGDANHSGRRQLDAATINRFAVIEWKNDDELEMRIATAINEKAGRLWLEWIRKVRVYCEAHHPRVIVSPRSTYMGAKALLDSPFTIEQIADMTLFKGLDKDTKAKILSACPFPAVSK
jgi:cobaltochelatase CobS